MEILQLKNVSLTYQTRTEETVAVDDVSFGVKEGEFVVIVGPSGCGKTSVLSLAGGLIKPTSGQITLDGKPVETNSKIGYMLQHDTLFEWRTIEKNVMLGLEVQKNRDTYAKNYAHDLLKKYGLYDFRKHYPSQLSGGMRQRAALIRTLALRPRLLLLDEAFSALDFQTRMEVCDDVHSIIKSEGKTALLVTHDISEAISLADRIVVLSKRPAKVKSLYTVNLDGKTPFERRENKEFSVWFDRIWRDIS
ncbi:MAG: ABC transporter ATP-binding protein [Clostridia bacterium]|nr:ABC transporter ATP-binding protein [Clostridia bacterium]